MKAFGNDFSKPLANTKAKIRPHYQNYFTISISQPLIK